MTEPIEHSYCLKCGNKVFNTPHCAYCGLVNNLYQTESKISEDSLENPILIEEDKIKDSDDLSKYFDNSRYINSEYIEESRKNNYIEKFDPVTTPTSTGRLAIISFITIACSIIVILGVLVYNNHKTSMLILSNKQAQEKVDKQAMIDRQIQLDRQAQAEKQAQVDRQAQADKQAQADRQVQEDKQAQADRQTKIDQQARLVVDKALPLDDQNALEAAWIYGNQINVTYSCWNSKGSMPLQTQREGQLVTIADSAMIRSSQCVDKNIHTCLFTAFIFLI